MLESSKIDLDFLDECCANLVLPDSVLREGRETVADEREAVMSNLPKLGAVYGFNTLTGHRDDVVFSESDVGVFNEKVLDSHCIGRSPWFDRTEVKYLVFAKIYSVSLGGTGVSLSVFDKLCSVWLDKSIMSAKIPCSDTYSSGDVIPGAHLARYLNYDAKSDFLIGDMMAMINGSFVHLGYAFSVRSRLIQVFDNLLCTVARSLSVVSMGENWVGRLFSLIDECCPEKSTFFRGVESSGNLTGTQVSVSFRGIPELIQSYKSSMRIFDGALATCFSRRSANPLFVNCGRDVISQASFLSPELSLATSQLIDLLQFCAWQSLRRINFMLNPLSGNPQDAISGGLDLGLIQVPKRLQARLDAQRLATSTRPFALGSDASSGVEDSWTYGVLLVTQLKRMLRLLDEMLLEETAVAEYILHLKKGGRPTYSEHVDRVANERNLTSYIE